MSYESFDADNIRKDYSQRYSDYLYTSKCTFTTFSHVNEDNMGNFIFPSCSFLGINKEPLDESEKGEWKSWLKTQHSKN